MPQEPIPRRQFLLEACVAGTAAAATRCRRRRPAEAQGGQPAPAQAGPAAANPETEAFQTLHPSEVAFCMAAVDTIIPADELSPSGTECGVVTFIDRQLAGAWGGGAKMYRNGPFRKGKPEYGYQLQLTPREFFAAGIVATNAWVTKTYGKDFDRLPAKERDDVLQALDQGRADLVDFNGKEFFEALLAASAWRGSFPIRSTAATATRSRWKMIGFPGLPATYANLIEPYRNKRYAVDPQSIADFS